MKRVLFALLVLALSLTASAAFDPAARWIGAEDESRDAPLPKNRIGGKVVRPWRKSCLRLRRRFDLPAGEIASARITVTGLGFYELWVNGRKADERRMLAPGWSNPDDRILYDEYDVTAQLASGAANAVGVWLAPGYSPEFNHWGWRWFGRPRAILSLSVAYRDGRRCTVVSDDRWEVADVQPISEASIYNGETYDANREDARWASADGFAGKGRAAVVLPDLGLRLRPNEGPAIRVFDPIPPVRAERRADGSLLLDFGVNRSGVVEMRAKLTKGTRVTIQCAEDLKSGEQNPAKHRNAAQTDVYVASGAAEGETYRPRFTYHGFRYAVVRGLPEGPEALFRAFGVSADVRPTATFRSSDETLNWLWEAAQRTIRSNLVSYPEDCCNRGERTPCLMDSQVCEDVALQMFDLGGFYAKWIHDAAGYELAIDPVHGNNDNPDWAGEPIQLAGRLVRWTGAAGAALREYPRLREIALSFAARSSDRLWTEGFGDWCAPNRAGGYLDAFSAVAFVNSALLIEDYRVMAELAALKGEGADAQRFRTLQEASRTVFLKRYYDPQRRVFGEGRQVEQILPLAFGLVPGKDRAAVVARLVRRIREVDGGRIGTGIYGTRYLGDVLLDNGFGDLWLSMVKGPEWPSFGFMRAAGATSLWEQWVREGGMTSLNHSMFAGATTCFLTHLGGLRPAKDAYREILLKPCFPAGLDRVEVTRTLPCGEARVSWRREQGGVRLDFELPNVPARLELPDGSVRTDVSGRPLTVFVKGEP